MIHKFGSFEFDSDNGELRKNGRAVALEPQPAKALALLLSRAGDIVSRNDLRDAVWGRDTHVDFDRGLAYCVSQIRTALGDSGENPRFVQTVPKRGFKFIAPISGASGAPGASGATRDQRATNWKIGMALAVFVLAGSFAAWLVLRDDSKPSSQVAIAVSVFDNETGLGEHDRIVAGLSDLVVERLTKLDPRLAVIGNASVLRQPRNIRNLKVLAQNVQAEYILLGQLQQGEEGLRFITHFIRLSDEAHLKANRLTMPGGGIDGLEAAVVEEFERAVRDHILNRPAN
jgi:DNA-binding winged helix-turn-helix (wHTH) protein/TolB-like protein